MCHPPAPYSMFFSSVNFLGMIARVCWSEQPGKFGNLRTNQCGFTLGFLRAQRKKKQLEGLLLSKEEQLFLLSWKMHAFSGFMQNDLCPVSLCIKSHWMMVRDLVFEHVLPVMARSVLRTAPFMFSLSVKRAYICLCQNPGGQSCKTYSEDRAVCLFFLLHFSWCLAQS